MTRSLTPVRVHKHSQIREEGASLRERKSGAHEAGYKREHVSVLLKEAVDLLDLKEGDFVVDATAGSGGHSEAMVKHAKISLLAIDADKEAVERTQARLDSLGEKAKDAEVVVGNFGDLDSILGEREVDKVLFDLGWNIEQLTAGRGFSFMHDEPLDMRYGEKSASGFTAAEILNTFEEKALADIFFGYGEERYARKIAKAIVARREIAPIKTTFELVELIRDAVPPLYRHGRLNPATKSFQALRIAVNDELGVLEKGLKAAWKHLKGNGRIAVITFHSIEDRLVKRYFVELKAKGSANLLTKKPITASKAEIDQNPPSRSGKLRGIEKCNDK